MIIVCLFRNLLLKCGYYLNLSVILDIFFLFLVKLIVFIDYGENNVLIEGVFSIFEISNFVVVVILVNRKVKY